MDRETEIALLRTCLARAKGRAPELGEGGGVSSPERYLDEAWYRREMRRIFRAHPLPVALESQIPEVGSYIARDWVDGIPLLVARGKDGVVRAFANVCRHRGARLLPTGEGCKRSFSCPYHAWTYAADGSLQGAPQFDVGFPGLDKSALGLREFPVRIVEGVVFVHPDAEATIEDDFLPPSIVDGLGWLGMSGLVPFETQRRVWKMNWKTFLEGGIEAYHFDIAHKNSLARFFLGNVMHSESWGAQMRIVLPKRTLLDLESKPESEWRIREVTNVLYSVYPTLSLLVQPDTVDWIMVTPMGPHETCIEVTTLVPKPDGGEWSAEERKVYATNHAISSRVLAEDFVLGETIHANQRSGLVDQLRFGRFESALARFHRDYEAVMGVGEDGRLSE